LALALSLAGCVYQLGSSLPPNLKTVYVPAFVNQCGEPQVENETTQDTIAEFQRDGSLEIVPSAKEADLVVEATLSSYKLEPLRYEKDQPKTTKEYRLRLGASITVTQTKTKTVLAKRSVAGEATFLVAGDLTSSKRTALPAAARDLAHKIVQSVTEAW
jgi:NAD-dependent DNA ligase